MWARIVTLPVLAFSLASRSQHATETGVAVLARAEQRLVRYNADLAVESCIQQDLWHRTQLQSQLKGLCFEMCKVVGLYPNCPQCEGTSAHGPGEFSPGSPVEGSNWDALLFHMDQMSQWGRSVVRHWASKSGPSQLQLLSNTTLGCEEADVARREELQGKILDSCNSFCHGHACNECQQVHGPPQSWPLLMAQVQGLSKVFSRSMEDARAKTAREEKEHLSLFCFAWTPRRDYDEQLLGETRKQYRKCDGHIFYTDHAAPGPQKEADFMRVIVPKQSVTRKDDGWLYHRNMVGLMPSWNHLLHSDFVHQHDWFINSELDHFLSPARAKETILAYLKGLREGTPEEQASVDGPIMLMWGNAFVFNRKMLLAVKSQWNVLGRIALPSGPGEQAVAAGCPMFMENEAEWPQSCSQDVVYPVLAKVILPKFFNVTVGAPGSAGCGAGSKNGNQQDFPLGCWELHLNPIDGEKEDGALQAIKELAQMSHFQDARQAREYCQI